MGKLPAIQFYTGDWLKDPCLKRADFTAKGIWIDLMCYLWESETRGRLSGNNDEFRRMLGCSSREWSRFKLSVVRLKFADFEELDGEIIITSRRMYRDQLDRISGRNRQQKLRDKGGGDPNRWAAIRVKILDRDKYLCAYCGRKARTVDHINPKSKGGDESDENLVACCKKCNNKKTDKTPVEAGLCFWKGFELQYVIVNPEVQKMLDVTMDITPDSQHSSSSSSSSTSVTKENIEKKKGEPVEMNDVSRAVCMKLRDAILEDRPTIRIPESTLWPYVPEWGLSAKHLLYEDMRDFEEVVLLIDWISKHDFWGPVILDVTGLRKSYDKIKGQYERDKKGTSSKAGLSSGGPVQDGRADTPANTARRRMAAKNKGKWVGRD